MALSTGTQFALAAVVAGALGFLVLSDSGEGVLEYVYANQVAESPEEYQGREIKVHGIVVEGSVRQKKGDKGDYRFEIEYEGRRLKVHYTDLVPDTFQEGGEVVLTGRLEGDTLESDEMSAKCPSKYQENESAEVRKS